MADEIGTAYLFVVRLGDGGSHVLLSVKEKYADALADAEAKRELYFPFDPAARIEQWSRDGKAWRQISRQYDCEGCPDRDVMPSLGCACYVSCGGTE